MTGSPDALRTVLRAEHAAIWVAGLAEAFATESRVRSAIAEALAAHQSNRDAADRILRRTGDRPPVAEPAYSPAEPVEDQDSAIRMLIISEQDCQVGWRSVLETSGDPVVRRTALDAMTVAAVRATRWRLTLGEQPAAEAFPGVP